MTEYLRIVGGIPLRGTITIAGAKNAVLPIMPAVLLTDEPMTLVNLPDTTDVALLSLILSDLGVSIIPDKTHALSAVHFRTQNLKNFEAPYKYVSKMRASILVLGAMLGRFGQARVALPGGCAIGTRPIDLHIAVLESLGATITVDHGYLHAVAPAGGLVGTSYTFPKVSVGATENALLACVLARGTTVLKGVACEPEVTNLIDCLLKMGACIDGRGTSTLTIEGVDRLHGCIHHIMPDRIQAGSYMAATLATGGDVLFHNMDHQGMVPLYSYFRSAGAIVEEGVNSLRIRASGSILPISIETAPFPGFPTDMQAPWTVLMCCAAGSSHVRENIFENRFMLVPELRRMGAVIDHQDGQKIIIHGGNPLSGAEVQSTDLRASFALVMAGLIASGETLVGQLSHLYRGYDHLVDKLRSLGASIDAVVIDD